MIAPSLPARTGSGYAMRFGIFAEALAAVAELDVVVPVILDDADVIGSLPASLGALVSSFATHVHHDTPYKLLTLITDPQERVAAFRAYGRPSAAAGLSSRVMDYLRALGRARQYDLVHVERVYLAEAGLAAASSDTVLSLDIDEDDRDSMRSQADLRAKAGRPSAAEWLEADAEATDRLLARVAGRFPLRWISSVEDGKTLTARHPELSPTILPNAIELPETPRRRDDGATLLFVGALGYLPNEEGILWFAREVWPHLAARSGRPLQVLVAGPNPPASIEALGRARPMDRLLGRKPPFRVLGRVPHVRTLYETSSMAIAPLFGGRGTRIKLLEAAAEAVPVVATPDAARGLPLEPAWAWIAGEPDAFADACLEALENKARHAARVIAGRALVAEQFDRAKVISRLKAMFAGALAI